MKLEQKEWTAEDDGFRSESNTIVTVSVRKTGYDQGAPVEQFMAIPHEACGWMVDPTTNVLSIRRRVMVTVEIDAETGETAEEPIAAECACYAPGQWVSVTSSDFIFDREGIGQQVRARREAEDRAKEEAAMIADVERNEAAARRLQIPTDRIPQSRDQRRRAAQQGKR